VKWDKKEYDPSDALLVYGAAEWASDGSVLLYDRYDIWQISPDGKSKKRLTNGREIQMQFRFWLGGQKGNQSNYMGAGQNFFDLNRDNFIKALDLNNGNTGYYLLRNGKRFHAVFMDSEMIERLLVSENGKVVTYLTQRFDVPPHIVVKRNGMRKIIFESNLQQDQYYWGKTAMISYHVDGKELHGALYYPANFDSKLKYPMVVYIYDTVSQEIHQYIYPSQFNSIGFNVANLTAKGYFVLMPDVVYKVSDPGQSVLDCVSAAVDCVVGKGIVDSTKIGLIGHSFGGYETNFILTKSKLFAAAVSSSSVSDIVSMYLSVGKSIGTIDAWRFEDQQFRLGQPLYKDFGLYDKNNPIRFAADITTPLLLWAGKNDAIINPSQSMELYIALRRMEKKTSLILYPDEQHTLNQKMHQIDATKRVEGWFDYYLKGHDVDWINGNEEPVN
jgi:dipeptidyl aminopeptidase/acylaminoacyl peptidase